MVQFQTHVSQKGASDSKNNFVSPILKHHHKQEFYSKLLKKQAKNGLKLSCCLKMVQNWYIGIKKVQDA